MGNRVSLRHLPFHRVLHRPSQFLGGEREPALMTLIIAVDQKLADRSPLLRLASEKLTPVPVRHGIAALTPWRFAIRVMPAR